MILLMCILKTGNYATKEEKLEFLNEEFEKKGI